MSADSLKAISEEAPASANPAMTVVLPSAINELRIAGAPLAHWLILTAVALVAFLGMRLVFAILLRAFRTMVHDPETHRGYQFADAAFPPLSLYIAVVGFFVVTQELQVGDRRAPGARALRDHRRLGCIRVVPVAPDRHGLGPVVCTHGARRPAPGHVGTGVRTSQREDHTCYDRVRGGARYAGRST